MNGINTNKINRKIGIVTFGRADNYGAVLQGYSLCRYINKNFGRCEVIDFTPNFMIGRYSIFKLNKKNIKSILKSFIGAFIRLPLNLKKKTRFESFRKLDDTFSKEKYVGKLDDRYDTYIVGSDQVFNLELTHNDIEFFMPRIDSDHKKITYAASVGVSSLSQDDEKVFKDNLEKFEYISIREKEGQKLIQKLFPEKNIQQHIDPVFLTSKSDWRKLIKARIVKEKYILIYAFKDFKLAYSIAKELDEDIKIVFIRNDFKKIADDVINIKAAGPLEFLSLIRYAEFVITDSFHGTAFSIIFEKNFISIPYKGTESRFYTMLDVLGLINRIYQGNLKKIERNINYNEVGIKLEQQVKKSHEYLKSSLEEKTVTYEEIK